MIGELLVLQNFNSLIFDHSQLIFSTTLSMKTFTFVALVAAAAGQASAICAGFNYGIGNQQNLGGGVSRCE